MKVKLYCCAFLLFVLGLPAAVGVYSQDKSEKYEKGGFCRQNTWSNGDKVSFSEVREATMSAGGLVNVDAGRNGGVSVRGENRRDVLVRACVQTWGASDDAARALARGVRIETGSTIRAENSSGDENGWSVSYEISVPRTTNLKLTARNGGIHIKAVEGAMEFDTTNGGIHLSDVAGDVKGRTTNGGVHITLTGANWRGSGLDVMTTNGGVHLSIPENFAARIETGTTNGGFHSDFPALSVEKPSEKNGWNRRSRVAADLNGGGAPLRLMTTNGGVHIKSSAGAGKDI